MMMKISPIWSGKKVKMFHCWSTHEHYEIICLCHHFNFIQQKECKGEREKCDGISFPHFFFTPLLYDVRTWKRRKEEILTQKMRSRISMPWRRKKQKKKEKEKKKVREGRIYEEKKETCQKVCADGWFLMLVTHMLYACIKQCIIHNEIQFISCKYDWYRSI